MFPVSFILNLALPHQKICEHERSQSTRARSQKMFVSKAYVSLEIRVVRAYLSLEVYVARENVSLEIYVARETCR